MNDNEQYISPEEEARIEQAKLEIKAFYMNFFRHCALKKNQIIFNQWRSYDEYAKHREKCEATIRQYAVQHKKYAQNLQMAKDRITNINQNESLVAQKDVSKKKANTKAAQDPLRAMKQ